MLSRMFKLLPFKAVLAALVVAGLQVAFTADQAYASDMGDWQKKVVKLISAKQVYPRAAMSQELEGRAKVQVSIDRTGAITKYELVQSTGHELLDAEVTKLMDRINPLPTPPASMSDENLTFILPLSWILQ